MDKKTLKFQQPGEVQEPPLVVEQACTYKWAAAHLGVSIRSVGRLVADGRLRKHRPAMLQGERVSLLSIAAVRELAEARRKVGLGG